VPGPKVERLEDGELGLVRPLLADLHLDEQVHFPEHPQLSRQQALNSVREIASRFDGQNVIFAIRDGAGGIAAFCWCVLFDPGTGLEGEVAELYVAPEHRAAGNARALLEAATDLFRERRVTLAYVWTREENRAAVRLYEGAGFRATRQLVLTWYPSGRG
jgi:ribosomal protein S18 acetylase RimI-like enzyme